MTAHSNGNNEPTAASTRRVQQVLAFVEIANAMLEATDLAHILSAITREFSRLVDFDLSSVAILTADKKQLIHQNIHKRQIKKRARNRARIT